MPEINLWAYHADFGALCRNAKLDKPNGLLYPFGNTQGQAGWDAAVVFSNLKELADKLSAGLPMPRQFCGNLVSDCDPIRKGELTRLAICLHGNRGGVLAVNGRSKEPKLNPDNIESFHSYLHTIGLFTRAGSTILLMGCLAGQGEPGTRLLAALARIWPRRTVVGFSTVGYRHPGAMKRPGEPCELPGMRDTDAPDEIFANPAKWDSQWSDFKTLPWASEISKHAKVVRDAVVLRCPPDELCTVARPGAPTPSAPSRPSAHPR